MVPRPSRYGLVIIGVLAVSWAATAPATGAERRVALGVTMRRSSSPDSYDAFTEQIGRAPAIWGMARSWLGQGREFPNAEFLRSISDRGTVPMIVWQPVHPEYMNTPRITYDKILAGNFDAYIREFALAARDFGRPVILRFAHEMDGAWFPWGVHRFSNTPAKFKRMWRYVWNKYRAVGATNVRWLWSPNIRCTGCPRPETFFPGDRYVDYVGFSAFNWGSPSNAYERRVRPDSSWRSMMDIVRPGVTELSRVSSRRIIIAELGSSSDVPAGQSKAGWIRNGYPAVYHAYRRVSAIVYFNIDMRPPSDRHEDWRLTSPGVAPRDAYRALLEQSRFQGRVG
jgi:hypothetical protein